MSYFRHYASENILSHNLDQIFSQLWHVGRLTHPLNQEGKQVCCIYRTLSFHFISCESEQLE